MQDEILGLTQELIAIPSTKDKPEELKNVINKIKAFWDDLPGLVLYEYNSIPSCVINLSDTHPRLILNGHADVVPATPNQFIPKTDGNKLFGRGAQDMKSGLATMLVLAKNLAQTGQKLPLGIMVVCDEEVGGFDGSKKLLHEAGIKPEFFLAGESTDLQIEYQAKGPLWLKLKVTGTRAHAAYLWEGKNAIRKAAQEIIALDKIFPEPDDFVWETTCNFGKITGGQATNQVPGETEIILDLRRIPQDSAQGLVDKIKANLTFPDTQIEVLLDEPTHSTDQNHPTVQKLASSITKHTGKPAKFIQKCGASDARHYSAVGIPAVCFGPTGSGLHTDHEWLDIPSLRTYYQILHTFVLDFFSASS